jgi:metallo-beta-lactamase family protein
VILRDSARIQQEDVQYKRKRHQREGRRSPHPYEPLYTTEDVDRALARFRAVQYGQPMEIPGRGRSGRPALTAYFHDAGHILGSAIVELLVAGGDPPHKLVFSGDLGSANRPFVNDPSTLRNADTVVVESTYGDREHERDPGLLEDTLEVFRRTFEDGGKVVVPSFAVERAQEVMYYLAVSTRDGKLPRVPVFVDSPMAVDVTEVFARFRSWFDDRTRELLEGSSPLRRYVDLRLVRSVEESKALNELREPCVIISSSGMCTGGRVKHHLIQVLPRPECAVVFVGYQAHGTLGRRIVNREKEVRIHGRNWPVRARIHRVDGLSAHADHRGLLRWLGEFGSTPRHVFVTHGEESVALKFAGELRGRFPGAAIEVPAYEASYELPADAGS